jgi:hypothetical protein
MMKIETLLFGRIKNLFFGAIYALDELRSR